MTHTKKLSTVCLALAGTVLFSSCSKQSLKTNINGQHSMLAAGATTATAQMLTSTWETVTDGSSFTDYPSFEAQWNYLYPWGSDHNGTARMYGSSTDHSQIYLNGDGSLTLKATYHPDSLPSNKSPYPPIHYHSGTIYSKHQVLIDSIYPYWEISVDLQAPTAFGTWPAFWITAVNTWPPESDIVEVKGNTSIWQNTYDGSWQTRLTTVANAATTWHHYKGVFNRVKNTDGSWSNSVECQYFIDGVLTAAHVGNNFANAPFWLIIDLQMEEAGGSPGPQTDTYFKVKNVVMRRGKTPFDPNASYKLVNVNSGQVLAVPSASTTQGVTLIQWPWLGGNEQQWQIGDLGGGYYSLTNRNSGQVADVKGSSTTQGASVIQWPSTGGNNQMWQIARVGSGIYNFKNRNSGMALDMANASKAQGDTAIQWPYQSGSNQQWQIISQQ
ncbi:RICIN domain-containing protein [Chitinophaga sp. 212800010-3]|uniref:RICIN domain-containing protein n=1 Tax=unclassified Chitinophaga TaxID=2619133 RepID=UPI002DE74B1D|nr:hypothetical protein [Chitinophaga sp. 212800010-3]